MNALEEIKNVQNAILVVLDENYKKTISNIIKGMTPKNSLCFVSVNKTKNALEKEFKEKKISTEKIFFVDCISKSISKGKIKWSSEKEYFVDNPNSLTQMSLAIFKIMEKNKIDFLILDSINTLLIYNDEKSVLKFIHHTTGKLKENNTKGVFIYLKEGMKQETLKKFSQFTDKVIESKEKAIIREKISMNSFEEIKL